MTPPTLPPAVMVALGLTGCIHSQVCLSVAVCLDQVETDAPDTGDTFSVCLSTVDTQETGDTADTGCDSGDTGCADDQPEDTAPVPGRRGVALSERARAVAALADSLPQDVLERLRR